MITVAQASERLGVSSRRVRQYIESGRLPAIAITPRMYLLEESDVDTFKPKPAGWPKRSPQPR